MLKNRECPNTHAIEKERIDLERRRYVASFAAALVAPHANSDSAREKFYSPTFFEKLYHSIPGKPTSALLSVSLRRAARHVVRVIVSHGEGGGSGILVGNGWVLTANHVFGHFWQKEVADSLVVTDFDIEYPTETRNYFVFAPELGFYTVSSEDENGHLDYTLSKLKPADPRRPGSLIAGGLRAASLPREPEMCWQSVIVGHPASACEAVERDWAYRTFKHCVVRPSRRAAWELVSQNLMCHGYSGGPVLGTDGTLLGMMSSQYHAVNETSLGSIVLASAIVEDVGKRFRKLKLAVPPGLRSVDVVAQTASVKCGAYPDQILYDPNIDSVKKTLSAAAGAESILSKLLPGISHQRTVELESCVGYISGLLPTDQIPGSNSRIQGTCFRIGHDWVLTAKHVIDCPARAERAWLTFRYGRNEDFAQFYGVAPCFHVRFCEEEYYSSDDRAFSFNGTTVNLDYALLRISWPSSGPWMRNDLERTQYLRVLATGPAIGQPVLVPQHRNGEPRAWYEPNKQLGSPLVQSVDSRRVYHLATTAPGASGAPLLVARDNGSDLAVIGVHTHPRSPQCDIPLDDRGNDYCLGSDPYWERHHEAAEQESWFGANIYAVMQDLMFRHRFDLNRVEGFRDALPNFGARYGGGAA